MIRDVLTVAWKEWRELLNVSGNLKGGRLSLVILLAVFGVFLSHNRKGTFLVRAIVRWTKRTRYVSTRAAKRGAG